MKERTSQRNKKVVARDFKLQNIKNEKWSFSFLFSQENVRETDLVTKDSFNSGIESMMDLENSLNQTPSVRGSATYA